MLHFIRFRVFVAFKPWAAAVLCAVAAAALYLPTLSFPLVWDDVDLVVRTSATPAQAFTQSFWQNRTGATGRDGYYRPLVNLSLAIDRMLVGPVPWYFHFVNLLLHGAVVFVFCLLLARLFCSAWAVLAGGLLFGLHPMLADSVAYVSGRTDLLAGLGLAVVLLGLVRWQEKPDWSGAVITCAGFAFGLLAKETATLVLPTAAAGLFLLRRSVRLSKEDWALLGCMTLLLVAYLLARYAVLGQVLSPGIVTSLGSSAVTSLDNFGRLLAVFFLPVSSRVFIWDVPAAARLSPFLLFGAGYIAAGWWVMKRLSYVRLAWLVGLLLLLPVAGLLRFGPVGRMLYLPGMGLMVLVVAIGRRAIGGRPVVVRAAVAVALMVAVLCVPAAWGRMQVWKDEHDLFLRMTREAPGNPAGHFNLAFFLRSRGDLDGAIREYRTTIALDSTVALAYSNLGALLQGRGELGEAAALYRRTIALRPGYALAHNNLGVLLYLQGDATGAASELHRALELAPGDAGAALNLARVYARSGMPDSANHYVLLAARLQPDHPQVKALLDQLQGNE